MPPILSNYRSLLFAGNVVGGFGFVQGMEWKGVTWNRRMWVVVTRVMS